MWFYLDICDCIFSMYFKLIFPCTSGGEGGNTLEKQKNMCSRNQLNTNKIAWKKNGKPRVQLNIPKIVMGSLNGWAQKSVLFENSGLIGFALMVIISEAYLQRLEDRAMQEALVTNLAPLMYER